MWHLYILSSAQSRVLKLQLMSTCQLTAKSPKLTPISKTNHSKSQSAPSQKAGWLSLKSRTTPTLTTCLMRRHTQIILRNLKQKKIETKNAVKTNWLIWDKNLWLKLIEIRFGKYKHSWTLKNNSNDLLNTISDRYELNKRYIARFRNPNDLSRSSEDQVLTCTCSEDKV